MEQFQGFIRAEALVLEVVAYFNNRRGAEKENWKGNRE